MKIDAKIQTGERFFKERDNNLFDAMPAVWRNFSIEACHDIVSIIDDFINSIPMGETV
jgi:hypothetical protein